MIDAAEALRSRVQTDLRRAMKARDAEAVSALRLLIAAIDNAGAVPVPDGPIGPGVTSPYVATATGPTEVARASLSEDDATALLEREVDLRRAAADEHRRLGRDVEAEQASRAAALIARYREPT